MRMWYESQALRAARPVRSPRPPSRVGEYVQELDGNRPNRRCYLRFSPNPLHLLPAKLPDQSEPGATYSESSYREEGYCQCSTPAQLCGQMLLSNPATPGASLSGESSIRLRENQS